MFDPGKLATVPPQTELYYWADYVELLCMSDVDGVFSAERLAQWAKFADDFEATSVDAQDADERDVLERLVEVDRYDVDAGLGDPDVVDGESGEAATGEEDENEQFLNYEDFGRAAEETDDRFLWCQNIFRLLADRVRSLGATYPFDIDRATMTISRRRLTPARRQYVFYLSCSLLNYVPQRTMQRLTAQFEVVSFEVMCRIVPTTARVDMYGTSRGKVKSRFKGTQFERLEALASELRAKVIVQAVDFHPRDRGDNGLDLVGWIPMHDPAAGVVSFFAQCACGKKWDGKQYEASHSRWRNFLSLKAPSTTMTFIPHYFRKPGEHWYAEADVSEILVDRLRALRAVAGSPNSRLPIELIDAAWDFRITTV